MATRFASFRGELGRHKREIVCHAIVATVAFGIITPALVMLLDRRPVLELEHLELMPNEVRSGEIVTLVWTAKEKRNCAGVVHRIIYDGVGKIHDFAAVPTNYHNLREPGSRTFSQPFPLPMGLTPGEGIYAPTVERWCNFMQQYFWRIKDYPPPLHFTILPTVRP